MSRRGEFTAWAVVAALVVASLSCGLGPAAPSEPNATQPSPGEMQPGPTEALSPSQAEDRGPTAAAPGSACQAENWMVVSRGAIELPYDSPGWKLVLATVAVENRTDHYGWVTIDVSKVALQTEDGYQYSPESVTGVTLEGLPGRVDFRAKSFQTKIVPPGFTLAGDLSVMEGPFPLCYLPFKVAESQHNYQLTIAGITISCGPGLEAIAIEAHSPVTLNANERETIAIPSIYPLPSIEDPIEAEGVGSLSLESIDRIPVDNGWEEVYLGFALANASGGYEANGILDGYLVGEDGVIYPSGWGLGIQPPKSYNPYYKVGPAQTGEVSLAFLIPSSIKNLALVMTYSSGYAAGYPAGHPVSIPDESQ
jgi:hypothetical protein